MPNRRVHFSVFFLFGRVLEFVLASDRFLSPQSPSMRRESINIRRTAPPPLELLLHPWKDGSEDLLNPPKSSYSHYYKK
jgi:hypothetical protein